MVANGLGPAGPEQGQVAGNRPQTEAGPSAAAASEPVSRCPAVGEADLVLLNAEPPVSGGATAGATSGGVEPASGQAPAVGLSELPSADRVPAANSLSLSKGEVRRQRVPQDPVRRGAETGAVGEASAQRASRAGSQEVPIAEPAEHPGRPRPVLEELLAVKDEGLQRPNDSLRAHPPQPGEGAPTSRQPTEPPARPAEAGGGPSALPLEPADRVRFVQRVARAMEAADGRGTPLRIRLHPPELGALRVEVAVRNGVMSARLEAETQSARDLLLEHLPLLRERLAEHNLRIERFEVQWSGGSSGGLSERPGQQAPGQPHPQPAVPEPRRVEAVAPTSPPPASARGNASSQIDIVV